MLIASVDITDDKTGEILARKGKEVTKETILACARLDYTDIYQPTIEKISFLEDIHSLAFLLYHIERKGL